MHLTDTHCHIHEALLRAALSTETRKRFEKAGLPGPDEIIANANKVDVDRMICVGTTLEDSKLATEFVIHRSGLWASIGLHPHEARKYSSDRQALKEFAALIKKPKVIAVGECGLDYFYEHSPKEEQKALLRFQIELALEHNLPMIFHVRDAFDDFWKIFDQYTGIKGVIHSFSAGRKELKQILERGLYVGLNGIMTFTKDERQLQAAKEVPLTKLLLETDAPFLTPTPYRGTMCEPKHVRVVAEFLASLRNESVEEIAACTTANAQHVFKLR